LQLKRLIFVNIGEYLVSFNIRRVQWKEWVIEGSEAEDAEERQNEEYELL